MTGKIVETREGAIATLTYAWLSQDHEEGKRAFAEKRKPQFTGR